MTYNINEEQEIEFIFIKPKIRQPVFTLKIVGNLWYHKRVGDT